MKTKSAELDPWHTNAVTHSAHKQGTPLEVLNILLQGNHEKADEEVNLERN